jgi:hypothetical protein
MLVDIVPPVTKAVTLVKAAETAILNFSVATVIPAVQSMNGAILNRM